MFKQFWTGLFLLSVAAAARETKDLDVSEVVVQDVANDVAEEVVQDVAEEKVLVPGVRQAREDEDEIVMTYYGSITDRGRRLRVRDATSISGSNFNSNYRTVVLVRNWAPPGYSANAAWVVNARNALYRMEANQNVIVVDWSFYYEKNYFTSITHGKFVGEQISRLLVAIRASKGLDGSKLWLIGSGAGAQVCGIVGFYFSGIGNIIGLDPAGPGFATLTSNDFRLDAGDATVVQVIHSDDGFFGWSGSHGSIDILVNGGGPQVFLAAASGSVTDALTNGDYAKLGGSHDYASAVFVSSIEFKVRMFAATSYSNFEKGIFTGTNYFGIYATSSAKGSFFVSEASINFRESNIVYSYYSSATAAAKFLVRDDAASFTSSGFVASRRTMIMIEDWSPSSSVKNNEWITTARSAIFGTESVNYIQIGWSTKLSSANYFTTAKRSYSIGYALHEMILALKQNVQLDFSKTIFIGSGMGAQIAAIAANLVKEASSTKIGAIYALDAAYWYFNDAGANLKLDKEDATFVQSWVTDKYDSTTKRGFGMATSIGHVDVFLNGGSNQPGATAASTTISFEAALTAGNYEALGTNHAYASSFFVTTVTKDIKAYSASSYAVFLTMVQSGNFGAFEILGLKMKATASGSFFAVTSSSDGGGGGSGSVDVDEIFFYYYASATSAPVRFRASQLTSISSSSFNAEYDTRIIVPDWNGNNADNYGWTLNAMRGYFKRNRDSNVILMDWRSVSQRNYFDTVKNVAPAVGDALGDFLYALKKGKNIKGRKLHMAGHGVGAHICGKGSKRYKSKRKENRTGRQDDDDEDDPESITSINAAYHEYSERGDDDDDKIDASDARLVQTIETDDHDDNDDKGGYGLGKKHGKVSCKINGGKNQPNVKPKTRKIKEALEDGDYAAMGGSNLFGTSLFVKSITTDIRVYQSTSYQAFLDGTFSSFTLLGPGMDVSASGSFFATVTGLAGYTGNVRVLLNGASSRRLGTISLVVVSNTGSYRSYNFRGIGSGIMLLLGGEMEAFITLEDGKSFSDYTFGLVFSGSILTSSFEVNSIKFTGTGGAFSGLVYSSCRRYSVPVRCSSGCPFMISVSQGSC